MKILIIEENDSVLQELLAFFNDKPKYEVIVKKKDDEIDELMKVVNPDLLIAKPEHAQNLPGLSSNSTYQNRFLVRIGNAMQVVNSEEIGYLYADGKTIYLVPQGRKEKFIVDYTLEELGAILDPNQFYRINRKFIINISSIETIHTYFNSRLILELNAPCDMDLIISRERVSDFKKWLNQ